MGTIRFLHSCRACVTFADEMKFDVKNTRPAVDRLHMAIRCWGLQRFLWLAWARCLHSLRFQSRAWACLSFRIQMGREGVYEHHGAPRGTLGVERAEPHLNQKHTPFSKKFDGLNTAEACKVSCGWFGLVARTPCAFKAVPVHA